MDESLADGPTVQPVRSALRRSEGPGAGSCLGWRARRRAATIHLAISAGVALGVLCLVYFGWYPSPLDRLSGVGEILMLLLVVDVTLGPLLTLVVYDRRKKRLALDMACIAAMQFAALGYGLATVEAGRPHFLVFTKDRFEIVSHADLKAIDRVAASRNTFASPRWFSPRLVAAESPADVDLRRRITIEAALGGGDLQHYPQFYRELASQRGMVRAKSAPLAHLRALNPGSESALRAAIAATGLREFQLRFLPIRGPAGDGAMLIDADNGDIVGMLAAHPWR